MDPLAALSGRLQCHTVADGCPVSDAPSVCCYKPLVYNLTQSPGPTQVSGVGMLRGDGETKVYI